MLEVVHFATFIGLVQNAGQEPNWVKNAKWKLTLTLNSESGSASQSIPPAFCINPIYWRRFISFCERSIFAQCRRL